MTEVEELARTLESVRSAFATLGLRWAVGGSLASSAHGQPRATNDVDVVADLDEDQARRLPGLLGPDFYCSADAGPAVVAAIGCGGGRAETAVPAAARNVRAGQCVPGLRARLRPAQRR